MYFYIQEGERLRCCTLDHPGATHTPSIAHVLSLALALSLSLPITSNLDLADAEERARKKEDLRRLKAEDDAALKALKKRRGSAAKGKGAAADGGGKKVTAFEIAERKVAEAKLQDDEIIARKMSAMNITSAAEYAGMLDQNGAGNANHDRTRAS